MIVVQLLHWFYTVQIYVWSVLTGWMQRPRAEDRIIALVEDGVVEVTVGSAVLLMQDAIEEVLRSQEVTRARLHPASLFMTAHASNEQCSVDITRLVQKAMSSFYVPQDMAVTAEDFLRWCARQDDSVQANMILVVVDTRFKSRSFRGSDPVTLRKN